MNSNNKAASAEVLPYAAIITSVLLWGGSFTATRIGLGKLGVFSLMSLRFLSAALVLTPFLPMFIRSFRSSFRKGDGKQILIMVLLQPCLYFLFESNALRFTTASQAGVISATVPLLTALGAWIILKEAVNKRVIFGMLIAVSGIIVITLSGSPDSGAQKPLLGNLLEFFAMTSAAGYLIAVRKLSSRYNTWLLTALQIYTGLFFFSPGLIMIFRSGVSVTELPWLSIIYLGAASSVGAFGLFNWGIKFVSAAASSSFINLIPIVAAFGSWLVLGELLNGLQAVGAGIVLTGVLISQ